MRRAPADPWVARARAASGGPWGAVARNPFDRAMSWLVKGPNPWASHALAAPSAAWLGLFLAVPLLYVLALSFTRRGDYGAYTWDLTLANYARAASPEYLPVLLRSLGYALATTALCLAAGYPVAYAVTFFSSRWRGLWILLLLVPFWNSCLLAIYSWMILLGREGLVNELLLRLGLRREPLDMLNTPLAVIAGLTYFYLPFMILPLYATLEKIPRSYIEAAKDLGATPAQAFRLVTLPLSLPGAAAGCILTFVPCVGDFLTAEFLGGTRTYMVGNLISQQFFAAQNHPFGGALAAILLVILVGGMAAYLALEPGGASPGRA